MSEGGAEVFTLGVYVSPGVPSAPLLAYLAARPPTTRILALQHDHAARAAARWQAWTVTAAPALVEAAHAMVAVVSPTDRYGAELLATAWNTWLPIRTLPDGQTFRRGPYD